MADKMLFDTACYELAKHFGEGYTEDELRELASDFQDAAETFHSWREDRLAHQPGEKP